MFKLKIKALITKLPRKSAAVYFLLGNRFPLQSVVFYDIIIIMKL